MSGPEFVLSDDTGSGTWVARAAGWLELVEGYAASGFRRDAMPRAFRFLKVCEQLVSRLQARSSAHTYMLTVPT